ncbi:MAG TPA: radical SAM protein [Anaerolineales bacterium]|nr:radical SAM protein [Anaerolineales bacterium]
MEAINRLKLLTAQMHLEPAEDVGCPQLSARKSDSIEVGHATLPNGKRIAMLKTLLTSVCERNCFYCPFRSGRDFRRASFQPDEFANTFMTLHRAGAVEGIFLSSGVFNSGLQTQDKLLDTAEILRHRMNYRGYLHLKIMPGAERSQVERSMQLADRVSINLEAPNTEKLSRLAPRKQFIEELLQPLRWIDEIRRSQPAYKGWNGHWPSSVTQFVVGAVGDTDLELLSTTEFLYQNLRLKRAYFSAFNPIPETPLENQPATPQVRENRLYEASFLLRDYGFGLEELPFDGSGNLPQNTDPKLAWAQANLNERPVEINRADRHELLRVPGIGPKGANAIITARRRNRLQALAELRSLGINPKRAAPFILLNGIRPAFQPSFW